MSVRILKGEKNSCKVQKCPLKIDGAELPPLPPSLRRKVRLVRRARR